MSEIILPAIEPRDYQLPFAVATQMYKRIICRWHRRCGKDLVMFSFLVAEAMERKGTYYYIYPTATLGREALWENVDKDGTPFLDRVPKGLIVRKVDNIMKFWLPNGSSIQIRGADKMLTVGPNPIGVVFSEYAKHATSNCWDLIRPILAENGGFAWFNFTPFGYNHAYDLEMINKDNPKWYISVLTVEDTGAISLEAVEDDRRSGMDEATIQSEYYVSYTAPVKGAVYAEQMAEIDSEGRILDLQWDPSLPVDTFWDLGYRDTMSIWMRQTTRGGRHHYIDYYAGCGAGLEHYINYLQSLPYTWGKHYAPHDAAKHELGSGKSIAKSASDLGLTFEILPQSSVSVGITETRMMLRRCWFDATKCEHGIQALRNYRFKYNEQNKVWSKEPVHNWASHPADAFRYSAMADTDDYIVEEDEFGEYSFNRPGNSWMRS